MKTDELTGATLDCAVATCEGAITAENYFLVSGFRRSYAAPYSSDWAHGGPIIEREEIWVRNVDIHISPAAAHTNTPERKYLAQLYNGKPFHAYGPTPLIAAMRCYVASKLGDAVDIPEELK